MKRVEVEAGDFVRDVEAEMAAQLTREPPRSGRDLWAAARHTCLASAAKRARPRLVFLFGEAMGAPREELKKIAVAAELIHAASLVHDDVIDEGTLRRGQPTVNALWRNITAVLSGDLMFSISFGLLRGCPNEVMASAVEVLREMSCAAIDEAEARGDLDLPLERWRDIAAGKTGALFGWCGSAPALLAGDEDAAARFARCGMHLGVAFQLADDLKDLVEGAGKDRFADIANKNPSFPILWAAAREPRLESALRLAWAEEELSKGRAHELGGRVLDAGAGVRTAALLREEVAAGLEALGELRRAPSIALVEDWASALLQQSAAKEAA